MAELSRSTDIANVMKLYNGLSETDKMFVNTMMNITLANMSLAIAMLMANNTRTDKLA